jgi:hypothetical protein
MVRCDHLFNSVLGQTPPLRLFCSLPHSQVAIRRSAIFEKPEGTHLALFEAQTTAQRITVHPVIMLEPLVGSAVRFQELPPRREMVLGAALATSGTVAMYHIVGVTPEGRTTGEALGGGQPQERIIVSEREIREVYRKLHTAKSSMVDFVFLGCPQYTVEQIRVAAGLLDKRRVHENTTLWIGTNRMAFAMAERMGYYDIIKKAGGVLVCDTCPMLSFLRLDSPKQGLQDRRSNHVMDSEQAKYANNTMAGNHLARDVVERRNAGGMRVSNEKDKFKGTCWKGCRSTGCASRLPRRDDEEIHRCCQHPYAWRKCHSNIDLS